MSKEYGMDPYDDSYDWQTKKHKGWREASIKSGTAVQQESPAPEPIDVVPVFVKVKFIEAADYLKVAKKMQDFTEADISVINRGAIYKANPEANSAYEAYKAATRLPKTQALEKIPQIQPFQKEAASRSLLLATG